MRFAFKEDISLSKRSNFQGGSSYPRAPTSQDHAETSNAGHFVTRNVNSEKVTNYREFAEKELPPGNLAWTKWENLHFPD
jgi:hypothetical protein